MADDLDLPVGSVHESAGQEQPEKPPTPEEAADKALVDEIVENYALVCSVESEQRKQEDEDLYFEGVTQWQQEHLDSRAEHTDEVTDRKVPARPTLDINLVEQPVQRTIGEARQARLAITVQPKAGLANTKQAGYFKGLIRAIQAESGATEARLWALERVAKCGRGAYEIDTEFANDGDFDLDIVYRRILNQSTVGWDVYSVMADRRDADWCIAYTMWMSEKERLRRWPLKPIIPSGDGAFENAEHPWFALDANKHRSVLVVVYYKVVYDEHILAFHPAVGSMKLNDMAPEFQEAVNAKADGTRTRKVPARKVIKVFADGSQILEQHLWDGRYIPVIPVTGKEYNIKGKRSWKGIVTNCKGVNRGYVVTISSAVELAGSMPRSPYIMYAGQDEGFEDMWDDSPIKSYSRLYVNLMEVNGKPVPLPRRENLEPQIQGVMLLARVLKDDIGSLTGSVDPALRAVNPYDRSGKAIDALNRQGAAGTSNFLDNLATISMPQEGRVMVDLIPKVYDKPGRVLRVMGEENDDETAIMIKRPFVLDTEGNPVPVPCPTCKGKGTVRPIRTLMLSEQTCPDCQGLGFATKKTMPKEFNGQPVEYVDLSDGEFKVSVSIGRNYQTKQEEAMASMSQLATAAPALVPVYADLWVRAMGFSGANEIADRIKKTNPHAEDDKAAKDVPPEFMAKYQQLMMEHQAAMQQLQKVTEALKTDQVKIGGQKEMLAMKLEAAEGLEHLKQQLKLMQETQKTNASKELEQIKGQIAKMLQESTQEHETLLELLQSKHALAKQAEADHARRRELILSGDFDTLRQEDEQRHEVLMQLIKEQGAKEIERHSVELHDKAAAEAEKELPNSGAE